MKNYVIPLHLGKAFPSFKLMFFGEIQRISDRRRGYTTLFLDFPSQTDKLELILDETPVGESYVPSDVVDFDNLNFSFCSKSKAAAISRMVDPVVAENRDLDVLEICGGPLFFIEGLEGERTFRQSNLLLQAVDFYSNLLRKNLVALTKADYLAAKNTIIELMNKIQVENVSTFKKLDYEEKMREAFWLLLNQLMEQKN